MAVILFQFQSGAVKSSFAHSDNFFNLSFQFQSGAVKSKATIVAYPCPNRVSIPKWCG